MNLSDKLFDCLNKEIKLMFGDNKLSFEEGLIIFKQLHLFHEVASTDFLDFLMGELDKDKE